jgi:hypothetical protein
MDDTPAQAQRRYDPPESHFIVNSISVIGIFGIFTTGMAADTSQPPVA